MKMAQGRIQDGLTRLVRHFISDNDEEKVSHVLQICEQLAERFEISE
jgi:hypothetical protein